MTVTHQDEKSNSRRRFFLVLSAILHWGWYYLLLSPYVATEDEKLQFEKRYLSKPATIMLVKLNELDKTRPGKPLYRCWL